MAHRARPEPCIFPGSVFIKFTESCIQFLSVSDAWLLGTVTSTAMNRLSLNFTRLCGAVFTCLSLCLLFH